MFLVLSVVPCACAHDQARKQNVHDKICPFAGHMLSSRDCFYALLPTPKAPRIATHTCARASAKVVETV